MDDLQRYYDIRCAIKHNLGSKSRSISNRSALKEYCTEIGIVHTDYISDLPVYRFTADENEKNEAKIKEAEEQLKIYQNLIDNPQARVDVYVNELYEVLNKCKRGQYTTH